MTAVFLVICVVTLIGLSRVGDAALRRERADALADVTALAAVQAGQDGASRVAAAAGARLGRVEQHADGTTLIELELQGVAARAAAAPLGAHLNGGPDLGTGRR